MASNGITLESVLQSVVHLTEQRSRENLEQCLVSTLAELTGVRAVTIARPMRRSSGLVVDILAQSGVTTTTGPICRPLDDYPLMARCLSAGCDIGERLDDGSERRCLPVLDGDEVVAFLVVESRDGLAGAEPLVHGFLAVYRNYLAVLKDSERDTLTGLKNRKTFDDNISRAIAHTRAAQGWDDDRRQPDDDDHHWLAIVDIDHFKRINDTYGHAFGDEVLLLFAALMRKVFRSEDLLFRFGGEEFVVVLAPTGPDSARQAFERLRETVEAFHFPQVGQVTASAGFVRIDPDDIPATVVGQADEALYWAKRHGRNRVCWYDDLVAAGELKPHATEGGVELF